MSIVATIALAVLVSGVYPLIVWGLAQMIFPNQANGSLLKDKDGKIVGSALIGQRFTDPRFFHPRPSAAGSGYDPMASGGTNLGPTSDKLINGIHKKMPDGKDDPSSFDGVKDLVAAYRRENGLDAVTRIPADAVTRSASGLDPHISVANALLQVPRIARARNMSQEQLRTLIDRYTQGPDLGILGEAGVNVLDINLALEDMKQ